jgi:hypothetical protein
LSPGAPRTRPTIAYHIYFYFLGLLAKVMLHTTSAYIDSSKYLGKEDDEDPGKYQVLLMLLLIWLQNKR